MTTKRHLIFLFTVLLACASVSLAQNPSGTPRQERLLNGLKVLYWNTPGAEKTTLKLRIHAGAAFDPQEKEGVMKLLSESFFPTTESRSFFKDELDGSFDVVCNYDYIQFTATAKNSDLITLIETVAQAIANPDLSKEATAALKTAWLAKIQESEKDGSYVADRAVAKRLFGSFPYGRPEMGTSQSLQKIDFADLRFARERLLTADNATLSISGNIDPALTMRAVRRYFGAWLKSDKRVPSTFRQPDSPDARPEIINTVSSSGLTELRLATRGVSRNDPDYPASEILSRILERRLISRSASTPGEKVFVRNEAHILPGQIVFGSSSAGAEVKLNVEVSSSKPENPGSFFARLLSTDIENDEFVTARQQVSDLWKREGVDQLWLDLDTFKIDQTKWRSQGVDAVTLEDVRRFANRIKSQPVATVWYFKPAST